MRQILAERIQRIINALGATSVDVLPVLLAIAEEQRQANDVDLESLVHTAPQDRERMLESFSRQALSRAFRAWFPMGNPDALATDELISYLCAAAQMKATP